MSHTHDTEHCLQKCGSGEPCDTSRCPMPTGHSALQVADLILGIPREPATEAGKLAVRIVKRGPEHSAVRIQLDTLMTKLKDL